MKIRPLGAKLFQTDIHDLAKSLFATLRTRLQTRRLILYRDITAVYSDTHTRQTNALCGQYVACVSLSVKPGVTFTEQRHGFEGFKVSKYCSE
jgi:hypothetical protein